MNRGVIGKNSLLIGKIVGAHGIGGNLKFLSYAESLTLFTPDMQLTLQTPSGNIAHCRLKQIKPHQRLALLTLHEITDRDQAERLAGSDAYIARSHLPPLEADAYYWSDLIGMTVYDEQEGMLGELKSVLQTGGNDVYVVEGPDGERLVPAVTSVVRQVDVAARRMTVRMPEGL